MANYSINCPATGSGYYDIEKSDYTSPNFFNEDATGYNTVGFARFNNSALNSYKKKKINAVTFVFDASRIWKYAVSDSVYRVGGSIGALKNTFSSSSTNNDENIVFNFGYEEIKKSGGSYISSKHIKQVTYFKKDDAGLYSGKMYRSLYEQLPIGFIFANNAPVEEKKQLRWLGWEEDSWIEFQLSDFDLITAFAPIENAFIDATKPNVFTVNFDAFESIDYPTVTKATVEIMDLSNSNVITYENNFYLNLRGITTVGINIPANLVVKNKNYQWRTKLTTDDGVTSFSEWATFTTIDAIPNAPVVKSPQSSYLDAAAPVVLSWSHDINTGSTQYAYDIDYKQDAGWVNFKSHIVTSTMTDTISSNTLEAGSFVWRVRTYNTNNVPGPYAESATNIVQSKPKAPIFSSINTAPKLNIMWQSTGQQAYELTIGNEKIYRFGVDKNYTYYGYLPDGEYQISLKIQNIQGVWSDTTYTTISIKNVPISGEDVITATVVSGGVRIDVGLPDIQNAVYLNEMYVGEFYVTHEPKPAEGTRFLLRNGIPIAVVDGDFYIDYASAGMSEYVLRVVRNGNYYDSPTVYAVPSIKYGVLAAEDNPSDFIPLAFRLESKPQPQKQLSKGYNSHYFSGRAQPVYDITEHYETTWPLEYSMVKSNYDKLNAWVKSGKPILIRYNDGTIIRGVAQGFTMTRAIKNIVTVSFTVMQRDYVEAIDYV